MNEILDAVGYELSAAGAAVESSVGRYPDDDEAIFVVIPHEFFGTVDSTALPTARQLRRTIALATEQPDAQWFELSAAWCRSVGATLDINPAAVSELRRRGVRAQRFQLGYTRFWDRWYRDPTVVRDVDIIHLGTETDRRLAALSTYASGFWDRRARILLPPVAPKPTGRPDYLVGPDKWDALASSKILLNLHRAPGEYLEWVRVLEAICNGAVVVTERVAAAEPLVAGAHYLSGEVESLGELCCALLDDPARLESIRQAAYGLVTDELPLASAVTLLANTAEDLHSRKLRVRTPLNRRALSQRIRPRGRLGSRAHAVARRHMDALGLGQVEASLRRLEQRQIAQAGLLKSVTLGQMEQSRELRAIRVAAEGHSLDPEIVLLTPAHQEHRPRVSVVIPLRNHAKDVRRALASIVGTEYDSLEVIVLDDGSTDDSLAVACDFLEAHSHLPAMLVRHRVNRGLGPTRNALVSMARGEFVFTLDADNETYPTAIGRLVEALDNAPDAWFAYSMLEVHDGEHSRSLVSYQPWDTAQLMGGNYIDAMALIRRSRLDELGGYTTDVRLYGWEDYDLWCKVVERGGHGVLVPEILGRYKSAGTSMISITNIDDGDARSALLERHRWLAAACEG